MTDPPTAPDPQRRRDRLAAGDRPYVTLKAATTLDGRIATRRGHSQWITGEVARTHAHRLRAAHDAVLVGVGTVLADDPRLTVRLDDATARPARVVLDTHARTPPDARFLAADGARRIVVTGAHAPPERVAALRTAGAEVWPGPGDRPTVSDFLPRLREEGIGTVLVEGGAAVHAHFIAHGTADELFLYIAGRVFGDPDAPGWCAALGVDRVDDAPRVRLSAAYPVGADVLLHGCFAD